MRRGLTFFAGFRVEEVAALLNISEKTVKRDWQFARVWLENRLRGDAKEKSQSA